MMTLGEKIKKLRVKNNMTQTDLAKKLKTTKQTIFKYEAGIIADPPLSRIQDLADALNVSTAYLMGWEETKKPPELSPKRQAAIDLVEKLSDDQIDAILKLIGE